MWSIGVAVLALLASDVFLTAFHPYAHGGPIIRAQTAWIWWAWSTLWGRTPERWRDRALSLGGPLIATGTLAVWGAALVAGYALIYYDFLPLLQHTEAGPDSRWGSALYYSGYVASTLGIGDVVPTADWLRLVTVLQALSGFVLVSVGVTYIISVNDAVQHMTATGLDVDGLIGDGDDAEIERLARQPDSLEDAVGTLNTSCTRIIADTIRHPLLHYFRPPRSNAPFVVQVGKLLTLFEALERQSFDWDAYPSLRSLRRSVHRYLNEATQRHRRLETLDDQEHVHRRRHAELLDMLEY